MLNILTPSQLPLAALIFFVIYALASWLLLLKLQNWLARISEIRFLKEDLGPSRHTVYLLGLLVAAGYLTNWSGVAARYQIDNYAQLSFMGSPMWVWFIATFMLLISMIAFFTVDRFLRHRQQSATANNAYKSVLWSTLRKSSLVAYLLLLLSSLYYFATHIGLSNPDVGIALGQQFDSKLLFSVIVYSIYSTATVLLIKQLFELLQKRDWGKEREELDLLRSNGQKLLLVLGAIVFLPVDQLLHTSEEGSFFAKQVFGVPVFWMLVYCVIAYLFARSFYAAFTLFEAEIRKEQGGQYISYLQQHATAVSEKTRGMFPGIAAFIISEKENLLRCLLTFLLILTVPLGRFLPYVLIMQCYFVNRLLVDAAYTLFIDDIRSALLKRRHLLLNLIARILGKLQWPLLLLITCLQAMLIMPEKSLVSKGLIIVSSFIGMAIIFELIDWYARSLTRSYLAKEGNKQAEDLDADGFPVFTLIAKGAVLLVIGLAILSSFGFDVTSIITGLGVAGFAIALALQSLLSDVFASVAISIDKPFTIGDNITVDKITGTVEKIGIKTTRIRTPEGQEVAVPNTKLTSFDVHNYNRTEQKLITVDFAVSNKTTPELLTAIPEDLNKMVSELEQVDFASAAIDHINADSVAFKLKLMSEDFSRANESKVKHEIYESIHMYLHRNGIDPGDDQVALAVVGTKNNPAKPIKNRGLGRMY